MEPRMEERNTPNRSVRMFQTCDSHRKTFSIRAQSTSDPKTAYEIEGWMTQGEMSCACPGFKFRGTCKHLAITDEICGWNGLESPEPQTLKQKEEHVCPRCGGRTHDVARGDF